MKPSVVPVLPSLDVRVPTYNTVSDSPKLVGPMEP